MNFYIVAGILFVAIVGFAAWGYTQQWHELKNGDGKEHHAR